MTGASVVLTTSGNVLVVTAAQIVLALLIVAAGIHISRLLNDAVPSTVRAGVASGVSTFTWIAFLPIALAFGLLSKHHGVHAAGWLITATTLAAGALLLWMTHTPPAATTPAAAASPSLSSPPSQHDHPARNIHLQLSTPSCDLIAGLGLPKPNPLRERTQDDPRQGSRRRGCPVCPARCRFPQRHLIRDGRLRPIAVVSRHRTLRGSTRRHAREALSVIRGRIGRAAADCLEACEAILAPRSGARRYPPRIRQGPADQP